MTTAITNLLRWFTPTATPVPQEAPKVDLPKPASALASTTTLENRNITQISDNQCLLPNPALKFGYAQDYIAYAREHHFTEIDLTGFQVVDFHIDELVQLPWLEKLTIANGELTDAAAKRLGVLTNLESLQFHWCWKLTDDALTAFQNLSRLRVLSLMGSPLITGAGLEHVTSAVLEVVDVRYCLSLTDDGFSKLKPQSTVHTLKFNETQITGTTLTQLTHFPGLKNLSLSGCTGLVGDDSKGSALLSLALFKTLEELDVSTIMTDTALPVLQELPCLRTLRMINPSLKLTTETLDYLKGLKSVEALYASQQYAETTLDWGNINWITVLLYDSQKEMREKCFDSYVSMAFTQAFMSNRQFMMEQARIK